MKHDEQAVSYVICSVCINSPPSLKKTECLIISWRQFPSHEA